MPKRCIQGLFDGVHIAFLANLLPGGKVHSVHHLIAATPGRRQIGAMNILEHECENDQFSIAMLVYQRAHLILIDYFAVERKNCTNSVLTNGYSYVSLLNMQYLSSDENPKDQVFEEKPKVKPSKSKQHNHVTSSNMHRSAKNLSASSPS